MHLSWCPQTWYSAWCSLTTTLASLEPASPILPIHPILQAKRVPPSTLSPPPTAPTEPKTGTRETNKSMCPSKALWLSMSVTGACRQRLPCLSRQTFTCVSVKLCVSVWRCMYVPLLCLTKQFSTDWVSSLAGLANIAGQRITGTPLDWAFYFWVLFHPLAVFFPHSCAFESQEQ